MIKKVIFVLLIASLFLVSGCKEKMHEESKSITGNSADFEFSLDSSVPVYEVQLMVRYSYGVGNSLDKLKGEIISPSGKRYSDWSLLSAKKTNQIGSSTKTLHFKNVEQEDGTFKLEIQKESGKTKLKKATLKLFKDE